jgi:PKD repeat protein
VEIYANPTASFTFTGSIDVSFNSTSTGGSTCFWDFGDGNTSTACAPTHTYAADGVYTVCLTSTNSNNCTDSVCQTVTIQGVGVKENAKNNFTFYPNPSEGNITITTSHLSTVQIVNIVGNIVSTQNINGTKTLDLSDLSKGSYFIKVTAEGKTETKKLILQ